MKPSAPVGLRAFVLREIAKRQARIPARFLSTVRARHNHRTGKEEQ